MKHHKPTLKPSKSFPIAYSHLSHTVKKDLDLRCYYKYQVTLLFLTLWCFVVESLPCLDPGRVDFIFG